MSSLRKLLNLCRPPPVKNASPGLAEYLRSSAALSSYLNQKYKGSVEAVERQLSEFFKLDEEAEAAAEKTASLLPRAAYVPTSISEDVCQSIRFAQLEHEAAAEHHDALARMYAERAVWLRRARSPAMACMAQLLMR